MALPAVPPVIPASHAPLRADRVSVRFSGLSALSGVDLELGPRELLGLIGPNGAGKTTLVNVLTGFQPPSGGRVRLGDRDLTGWPERRIARAGIVRTFQAVRLFRGLSVLQNLEIGGLSTGLSRRASRESGSEILAWLGLDALGPAEARTLSYAQARLVGLARALSLAPRFLLLDEPAAGMNDVEAAALMRTIAAVPERFGCAVLLIEHNMRVVMGLCERIQVIASGQTIACGSPAEVRRDPAVIQAYLGRREGS